MSTENNRHVDEMIDKAMKDHVPVDVERRLRAQLEDYRSRLGTADKPTTGRAMTLRRHVWWGAAATVAATIALAAMIGWLLRPHVSLADVAAVVFERPWIHVTATAPKGETLDFWCSPTKDISAKRDKDWIEYRDHRLRIYYSYDVRAEVVYRVPEYTPVRGDEFTSIVTALRVLLQNEQPIDRPLERLGFLGDGRTDITVVQQKLEKVEDGDRKWLDYHLTVRTGETPDPIEMLFRVDPKTKLVRLWRVKGRWHGKPMIYESRFDYPDTGPVDIYNLGVPKTAKLVDRVPSDDIARILEAHRAGRQRMDDYRAFHIMRPDGVDPTWWGGVEIMYRKGDKFRCDSGTWRTAEISKRAAEEAWPNPVEGEDLAAWWGRHMEDLYTQPSCIVHGSTYYYPKWRSVKDPDGSEHIEIESVDKHTLNIAPGDLLPPHWSLLSEFLCRPPMGIPSQQFEPVIELNPTDGPAGTILLHIQRAGRMPGDSVPIPDNPRPPIDAFRYWLDPARDYVAVRWDMCGGDLGEETTDSYIIEEMAKSPRGIWHATRVRRESQGPNGEKLGQILHFYLDFDVDLPDSLFELPKPGQRVQ